MQKKDMSLEDKFMMKAHMIKMSADEAGLSEEQVQKVKALKAETEKIIIRKNADIEVIKIDIWSKLYESPVDLNAVHALIDQKYEIKKEKAKAVAAAYVQLKGIPSEEQWDAIKNAKMKKW